MATRLPAGVQDAAGESRRSHCLRPFSRILARVRKDLSGQEARGVVRRAGMEVGRSRRFRFELFAADEPRAVPKTDQKQELARKALEQAFEEGEPLAKLDDDGNGGGERNDDRGGGGGGGGNDEGEVFSLAVKIPYTSSSASCFW